MAWEAHSFYIGNPSIETALMASADILHVCHVQYPGVSITDSHTAHSGDP